VKIFVLPSARVIFPGHIIFVEFFVGFAQIAHIHNKFPFVLIFLSKMKTLTPASLVV
jgi:hypothetical protein